MDARIRSLLIMTLIGAVKAAIPTVITNVTDNILSVSEDVQINSTLYTITIHDTDPGEVLTISPDDGVTGNMVWIPEKDQPIRDLPYVISVRVNKPFDRDPPSPSTYPLKFRITDKTKNQVFSAVSVYPMDVNDNAPEFNAVQFSWELKENATAQNGSLVGTKFMNIKANDRDNGLNGTVVYVMNATTQSTSVAAEYSSTFQIDPVSGDITLTKALDYEKNSYYQFNVIAEDKGSPPKSSSVVFIIRVLDVQDTPPFFTGIPYRANFVESNSTGLNVLTLNAVDGDHGIPNNIKYNITGGPCSDMFTIDNNGLISSYKPVDRDAGVVRKNGDICQLTVEASEIDSDPNDQHGNTTTSTNVTITVLDVNDNYPTFNETNLTTKVQENLSPGSTIVIPNLFVSDLDMDQNSLLWLYIASENGTNMTDFDVQPQTVHGSGTLTIVVKDNTLLDKEMRNSTTFLVIAQEDADKSHVANATVILDILDVNDNVPEFSNDSYTFFIDESSPNGTSVATITATDKDFGENGNVWYSIGTGAGGRFIVCRDNGTILVNCSKCSDTLNRERIDVFYLALTATDGGNTSRQVPITINLNDINDNDPIFSRSAYVEYIDEESNQLPTLQVEASDADIGPNAEIHYSITDVFGYDSQNFNITSRLEDISSNSRGIISLNNPVDYEKLTLENGEVIVVVKAEDKGQPPRFAFVNFTLRVQDENDNSPKFNETRYYGRILENATKYAEVDVNVTIDAVDTDGTPRNSQFRYFITAGSFDKFTINASSGIVALQAGEQLDRDNRPAYNLTIEAIDQGYPPLTGTTTLSVDIGDVNDKLPKFDRDDYTKEVVEGSAVNCIVNVTAKDSDEDSYLEYSIIKVSATSEDGIAVNETLVENYFHIDNFTGSISATNNTDRENASQVTLTIQVEDKHAFDPNPQTATVKVTITLLDVNDNSPMFSKTNYTVKVPENAENGPIIETIQAKDIDQNRTITYTISEMEIPFIVDSRTGALKKNGVIDRETNTSISFTVVATDNGVPPRNSSVNVTVIVLDFNDNAPIFTHMSYETQLPENATLDTSVLTVDATDKDEGPNSNITYKLEKGVEDFKINETTGVIMVSRSLDRETKAEYNFAVIAYDNPTDTALQKSTQVDVTIKLEDVNDNAPVFQQNKYSTSIREDVAVHSTVLTVTATDKDEDKNLTYEIEDGNGTYFFKVITNDNIGRILVNSSLKSHSDVYIMNISAKDSGGLVNFSVVEITVDDVNLNAPLVTNLPENNTINVYECFRVGTIFYNFTYSDSDKSNINKHSDFVMDRIQSTDTVMEVFQLNKNGSISTKRKLDARNDTFFRFQVSAINTGSPPLTSNKTTIDIRVIDVDDHDPSFTEKERNFTIKEGEDAGHVVGRLDAIDLDHDSKQCYKIEGGDSSYVEVITSTGVIVTNKEFDREKEQTFRFTARVWDCTVALNLTDGCDNETKTDHPQPTQEINIIILDINDNPPVFQNQEINLGIRRVTQFGTILPISLRDGGYVHDNDTKANGQDVWKFSNFGIIKPSQGLPDQGAGTKPCEDKKQHIFCVWSNGSVIINKYFSEDISGYFEVPIMVQDIAGNSTSTLKIFLIADFQIMKMTLLGNKAEVSVTRENILRAYSNITGHEFVFDWLEDHKTPDGRVQIDWTDMYFHIVEPKTSAILSASDAQRLVDSHAEHLQAIAFAHRVVQIVPSEQVAEEESSDKTIYIMAAVIGTLAVTVVAIIYVALSTRSSYKRKLKAATITTHAAKDIVKKEIPDHIPGSNMYSKKSNPLLNAKVPEKTDNYDTMSVNSNNSLDSNDVDDASLRAMEYDRIEEKEVTIDMFSEDGPAGKNDESPLDAAIRLHDIQEASLGHSFVNSAYDEELESTEI